METVYRLYRYAEDRLETNFYMLSTGFFVVFNLVFDLSLGTLFACILPDFIRKFKRAYDPDQAGDEDFSLLFPSSTTLFDGDDELMNEHRRALRKRNLFLSSTRTVLASAILNGNVLGEWKQAVLSIVQLAATGLGSGYFMYSDPGLLTDPINYGLNSSNNATLLHALKTGYLIYRIIGVLVRFSGDSSTGLLLNHLVYLLLVIESLHSKRFFAFVTFSFLIDLQAIFHFFRRAFVLIQLTDVQPYWLCNLCDLVLVLVLRPYVHFHQFNWLYTVYGRPKDYAWYLATLNASLQSLDTLCLLFDYFNLLVNTLREFQVRNSLPILDPDRFRPADRPIFSKLKRYDSDTDILYLK